MKMVGIEVDPERLSKFPPNFMKNLGEKVCDLIRNHVRVGGNDVFGKKLRPYTPQYAARKEAGNVHTNNRGPQHYKTSKPNLSLTGTTLNSLQVTDATALDVQIEFTNSLAGGRKKVDLIVANANPKRKNPRIVTLPSHPMPLTIHKYVWDTINNEIAKNLAKAIKSAPRTRGSVAKHGRLDVQVTPAK